jgi:acyl transferase domain-containing protein
MTEDQFTDRDEALEGIAVIGLAGRFPGANNVAEFWHNLINGIETITFYSDRELQEAGVDGSLSGHPDYVKAKGGLNGFDYFDASFFGINPREAELTDPQHRLLLECAWEALENAGYDADQCEERIAVFAGKSMDTYVFLNVFPHVRHVISSGTLQAAIGSDKDSLTTTISYRLNLKGPGITIQTSSSTSLVAVCVACQSLLTYQSDMALAGGVTLGPPLKSGYLYEEGGIVSPDGHCRAFDAKAKGFVPGAGMGLVVIKRLQEAVRDRDTIWAVIKGFAVNNDGSAKVSYTAPSVDAQAEVIAEAQAVAGVHPESIQYIEAHGTGTHLGDPIEIAALTQAFREGTDKVRFCAVGSVKSNIGHLDTAAGIAGLIKTVLALKHKQIPPSLHFESPNPQIDFHHSPFFVNTEAREWQRGATPRRAGVTSLGMGGTNAHVILEEAPQPVPAGRGRPCHLLLLSARTPAALETRTGQLLDHLHALLHADDSLPADTAYTLAIGRKPFEYRRALVCCGTQEAITCLEDTEYGADRLFDAACRTSRRPIYFMFTGQGSQYVNMARGLYLNEPVFKEVFDRCAELAIPFTGIDLREALYPDTDDEAIIEEKTALLKMTRYTQPVLFILEYAMAKLWMSWGIVPAGMIGHSIGEWTAACIAGTFSLEEALELVALRGRLMQEMESGAMISVAANRTEAEAMLDNGLSLAAVNGPQLCVLSGKTAAVKGLETILARQKRFFKRLRTSHAFHSAMMEPMMEAFAEKVTEFHPEPPNIPFISCVTGTWVRAEEAQDPDYWVRHLRRPVLFSQGVRELLQDPNAILLEVGPGHTLCSFVKQHRQELDGQDILNSIRHFDKNEEDIDFLFKTVARLWLCGGSIDWNAFYSGFGHCRVPLPTYPFERKRYWLEPLHTPSQEAQAAGSVTESHCSPQPQHRDRERSTFQERPGLGGKYLPPRTSTEHVVIGLWEELLGIRPIGRADDFFELGGHSLLATQFLSRLQEKMQIKLELKSLFQHPTPGAVAGLVEERLETGSPQHLAIPVLDREKIQHFPLSFGQERLWFIAQLDPAHSAYNILRATRIKGELDAGILEKSINMVIRRHEVLRTVFVADSEHPAQVVLPHSRLPLQQIDLCHLAGPEREERIIELVREENLFPFDLTQGPLLRALLVKLAAHSYLLLVTIHHIVFDGWSVQVFIREVALCYDAYRRGLEPGLAPLTVQYADYAAWQREPEAGAPKDKSRGQDEQEQFWLKEFKGPLPLLDLPGDRPRPVVRSFEGASIQRTLDAVETRLLQELALKERTTLFNLLLTAFYVFLARLCNSEDIVVGTPVAGRNRPEVRDSIGMFVNTIPLRNYPAREKSFRNFLAEVTERSLTAFEHQDYPYEHLVRKVLDTRDTGRNPLFDVMFIFQNMELAAVHIEDLEVETIEFEHASSMFDLTLDAVELDEQLSFRFEYATALFDKESVEIMAEIFLKVLRFTLQPGSDNLDTCIKDIRMNGESGDADETTVAQVQKNLFEEVNLNI